MVAGPQPCRRRERASGGGADCQALPAAIRPFPPQSAGRIQRLCEHGDRSGVGLPSHLVEQEIPAARDARGELPGEHHAVAARRHLQSIAEPRPRVRNVRGHRWCAVARMGKDRASHAGQPQLPCEPCRAADRKFRQHLRRLRIHRSTHRHVFAVKALRAVRHARETRAIHQRHARRREIHALRSTHRTGAQKADRPEDLPTRRRARRHRPARVLRPRRHRHEVRLRLHHIIEGQRRRIVRPSGLEQKSRTLQRGADSRTARRSRHREIHLPRRRGREDTRPRTRRRKRPGQLRRSQRLPGCQRSRLKDHALQPPRRRRRPGHSTDRMEINRRGSCRIHRQQKRLPCSLAAQFIQRHRARVIVLTGAQRTAVQFPPPPAAHHPGTSHPARHQRSAVAQPHARQALAQHRSVRRSIPCAHRRHRPVHRRAARRIGKTIRRQHGQDRHPLQKNPARITSRTPDHHRMRTGAAQGNHRPLPSRHSRHRTE